MIKCISPQEILSLSWATQLSPAQPLFCHNLQVHNDIHFQKLLLKYISEFLFFFTLYKCTSRLGQLAFALAHRKPRFFYKGITKIETILKV